MRRIDNLPVFSKTYLIQNYVHSLMKNQQAMSSSTETHFCNGFTQICACVLILLI